MDNTYSSFTMQTGKICSHCILIALSNPQWILFGKSVSLFQRYFFIAKFPQKRKKESLWQSLGKHPVNIISPMGSVKRAETPATTNTASTVTNTVPVPEYGT